MNITSLQTDILILGGGFAGFSCFRAVDRKRRKVNLLTNRNHFLFTPLLPLAATGSVEIRSIVEPIRTFEKEGGEVIVAKVYDLDPGKNKVLVNFEEGLQREVFYRTLVIAVGATTATYGIPGVEENTMFLKEINDARVLREKIIGQFERADQLESEARSVALNFLVVGGGPTGVETACEIHDLVRYDLKDEFPQLVPETKIQIIEAGKEILTVFDRALVQYAQSKLRQKGIRVRTQAQVHEVRKHKVILVNGEEINGEVILWATGNAPQDFVRKAAERLNIHLGKMNGLPVDRNLKVVSPYSNIYAIGDCAVARDDKDRPLPATGQVAMKEGHYLGRYLSEHRDHFFYFKTMGMLASLGSGSAIADLGTLQFKGFVAWWFWKAVYITRLVSLRNKVSVAFDWIKVRFFGRNTSRIDF